MSIPPRQEVAELTTRGKGPPNQYTARYRSRWISDDYIHRMAVHRQFLRISVDELRLPLAAGNAVLIKKLRCHSLSSQRF